MVTSRNTLYEGVVGNQIASPHRHLLPARKVNYEFLVKQKFFIDFSASGIVPMESADGKSATLKTESQEALP